MRCLCCVTGFQNGAEVKLDFPGLTHAVYVFVERVRSLFTRSRWTGRCPERSCNSEHRTTACPLELDGFALVPSTCS